MKVFLKSKYEGSSFYELLMAEYPHLLPEAHLDLTGWKNLGEEIPRGTTILALKYKEGVVVAGDRMATEGYQISTRRIEKVFPADEHSAIAISGAAGPCLEMAKLFQTELEHYEKLEGAKLSFEGKANKLAQMIKANLPLATKGLIVIPIFAGYDLKRNEGRIFKYDLTGGRYEETEFYATGSGGKDARNTMKKFYRPDLSEREAIRLALEALYDAADEDAGTAGPDLIRGIYPTTKTVTKEGIGDVSEEELRAISEALLKDKKGGD